MQNKEVFINAYNCISPIGFDVKENWNQILEGVSGLKQQKISTDLPVAYLAKVDDQRLEEEFNSRIGTANFTRLEKMLALAIAPIVEKFPPSEKSILILSTTKGNITALKKQDDPPAAAFLSSVVEKIAAHFGFAETPIVISNACVSGVMAISVAKNLIQTGKYADAFVIAGDELSEFVVSGFNSFQALSANPCKPYDESRDGISLGEAAAAAYISTEKNKDEISFQILGESGINDANHISGPSRTGEGLHRSIENALKEGQISAKEIDFLSAHGTATLYNDEMESIAFTRSNLQNVPVHSLKGFYGHTLGAAGLLETVIAMESAAHNWLVASKNLENSGVSHPINIIRKDQPKEIRNVLKTASGFGGCNAALVLQKIS